MELLTELERDIIRKAGELWTMMCQAVDEGPATAADLNVELLPHIHAIQVYFKSQAAARAYPDEFRLLGGWSPESNAASEVKIQPREDGFKFGDKIYISGDWLMGFYKGFHEGRILVRITNNGPDHDLWFDRDRVKRVRSWKHHEEVIVDANDNRHGRYECHDGNGRILVRFPRGSLIAGWFDEDQVRKVNE